MIFSPSHRRVAALFGFLPRRPHCLVTVEADRLVDRGIDQRVHDEGAHQRGDDIVDQLGDRSGSRHDSGYLLASEAHVPRLLDDVDPIDHPDERVDRLVVHRRPLQPVGDLLGDEDRGEQGRSAGGRLVQAREVVDVRRRAVGRHT